MLQFLMYNKFTGKSSTFPCCYDPMIKLKELLVKTELVEFGRLLLPW